MSNVNINIDNIMTVAGLINTIAKIDNKIDFTLRGNKIQSSKKLNIFSPKSIKNYWYIKKINSLLENQKASPRKEIMLPIINQLKNYEKNQANYSMLVNLLAKEMEYNFQKKILPSYLEIIKQLSEDDIKCLSELKETYNFGLEILYIQAQTKEEKKEEISNNSINTKSIIDKKIINNIQSRLKYNLIDVKDITLDNLERLGIIKTSIFLQQDGIDEIINDAFNEIKNNYEINCIYKLSYTHGNCDITSFGKQFIEICCK